MCIANLIAGFLKRDILSGLEMLVKLLSIATILDAKINNLAAGLSIICKIQSRRAIELKILSIKAFTSRWKVPVNVEDLNSASSRLQNAVMQRWVTVLARIPNGKGYLPAC